MAEAFDAPMTDSADIDISMHPSGMATADSWLSTEASMGDVAFSTETATFEYMQEGIEIEMIDDDEAITEYEMADDDEAYHGEELQDVEVLDASRAPSPPPAVDRDLAVDVVTEHAEIVQVPSSDAVAPAPVHPSPLELAAGSSSAFSDATADPAGFQPGSSAPEESLAPHEGVVTATTAADATSAPGESATLGDSEKAAFATPRYEGAAESNNDTIPAEVHALSTSDSPRPDVPDLAPSGEEHVSSAAQAEPGNINGDEASATESGADADAGDPHEISEGVYIDPPPPVLLSLPPSAEPTECCLFNQPQASAPLSPSATAGKLDGGAAESFHLLLHDRPTLYYEPLSAVFDALRHQECIQSLPGLAEAELALDAYELQLTISEDNLYAHEVTLHELNVIHDGSDLHGPLRLKLKTVAPRFVTRYHLLREQITRLNLTADVDELYTGGAHTDPPLEHDEGAAEGHHPTEDEIGQEAPHPHEHDGERTEDAHRDHRDEQSPAREDDPNDQRPPEVAVSHNPHIVDTAEQHAFQHEDVEESDQGPAAVGEGTPVVPTEHEEGEATAYGGSEENEEDEGSLDANEVHDQDDVGEGGDYVEHDQYPDDEAEFGEDLPEELGGHTADAAYGHAGVVSDGAYAEDRSANAPEDEYGAGVDQQAQDGYAVTSPSDDTENNRRQSGNDGVNADEYTNLHEQPNSANDADGHHLEGDEVPESHETLSSAVHQDDDAPEDYDAENVEKEESTTLSSEDEEEELIEDWDDGLPSADTAPQVHTEEALSRKSSTTTLASKASKRTYDEVELDDFDDDPSVLELADSPDAKRLRVE